MGTHLICIDLSMKFKRAPKLYAFIKKIRKKKKKKQCINIIQNLLIFFLKCMLSRYIHVHILPQVFLVILENPKRTVQYVIRLNT